MSEEKKNIEQNKTASLQEALKDVRDKLKNNDQLPSKQATGLNKMLVQLEQQLAQQGVDLTQKIDLETYQPVGNIKLEPKLNKLSQSIKNEIYQDQQNELAEQERLERQGDEKLQQEKQQLNDNFRQRDKQTEQLKEKIDVAKLKHVEKMQEIEKQRLMFESI